MRSDTSRNRRHSDEEPVRRGVKSPAALTDLDRALDAMPKDSFLATCNLLAHMHSEPLEGTEPFTKALGRLMGESMDRQIADRGPLDPDAQAFVDVIVGYFDDE